MHNGDEPEHILCRLLRHIFVMTLNENILWIKVKVNNPGEMQRRKYFKTIRCFLWLSIICELNDKSYLTVGNP